MCGICGEIYWDNKFASKQNLSSMLQEMVQRGPDDEGIWLNEHIGLGHRRLAIIDLSSAGHQPMQDGSFTLVFNGCIYNYEALKLELEEIGHSFQSHSDTEVILKAYRQWGMECVSRFEGMFAFAIWDDEQQQLLMARDRMGIKPLYYAPVEGGVRFASNTQALLQTEGIDTSIDPVGLHHQLTLHAVIPAPNTILKGIKKLEPGHWLIVNPDGQMYKKRFWHLEAKRPKVLNGQPAPTNEKEWVDAVHVSLKEAVHKRLTASDVPVGVLLSGGLDSSLVVAMLAEAGVENIKTFSIGFEDAPEEKGNEFEFSDLVVERYQTDHKQYLISNDDVLPRLHEAVEAMSEPMVGQDAIAFYLLSEQVAQDVKVVMSGQGADEVFGGYFWYPRMAAEHGTPLEKFRKHYFDRCHDEWLAVVDPSLHGLDYTSGMIDERLNREGADTFTDQVLRMDSTMLITDDPVKRVDNMTMAWGLEARVPFLDQELIELAATMPPEMKLPNGGKHVLKEMSRGFLPDSVVNRSKAYFPMPALKYVRGEFLEVMKEILFCDAARNRGLFNPVYVEKLMKNPEEYLTRLQGSKLWHLAALELWLQQNIDK